MALKVVARATANLLAIELSREQDPDRRLALPELGDWTWLREFDDGDLDEFVGEMRRALVVASREENGEPLEECLYRWRETARAISDPMRRQILMSSHSDDDFVEAKRPE